jgi:membrane protein implicated in regulation of membrane protease activity
MASPSKSPDVEPSMADLVAGATRDLQVLVRGEIALAKSELTVSAKKGGIGAVALVVAAVAFAYAALIILAGAAFWLATSRLNVWQSFLIVGGAVGALGLFVALVGLLTLKKVKGPQKTTAEAAKISKALKDRHGAAERSGLVHLHGETPTAYSHPAQVAQASSESLPVHATVPASTGARTSADGAGTWINGPSH